jgi:hypothetical protein
MERRRWNVVAERTLIAALAAIAIAVLAGGIVVRAIDPRLQGGSLLSTSYLVGISLFPLILFFLSLFGLRWSLATLMIPAAALCLAIIGLRHREMFREVAVEPEPVERQSRRPLCWLLDGALAVTIGGYALYATQSPVPEFDFISGWGLKALLSWRIGALDLAFLRDPAHWFSHPDYPMHVPLMFDYMAIVEGRWDDRWIGFLYVGFGAAIILLGRSMFLEEIRSGVLARVAALGLAPAALSPWVGIAEAPLIAYGAAGALFLRRGIQRGEGRDVSLAGVMLGLCALTKNEGLALAGSVIVGGWVAARGNRRILRQLWPAVIFPLPWFIYRHAVGLRSELLGASLIDRLRQHLGELPVFASAVAAAPLGKRLFWIAAMATFLFLLKPIIAREKLLLTAIVVQFAAYLAAYLVTPYPLGWHIATSWERIMNQLVLLFAFVVLLHAAQRSEVEEGPPAASDLSLPASL